MVSGQHVSYTKSTSVYKFKSASTKKPGPITGFTNPVAIDTPIKEDLGTSTDMFKPT